MKVGLYGGTFNPIHFGHLRTAEEIRERFQLKEVIFIPSYLPPHKDCRQIVDPIQRLKMVSLALTGNPYFSVSEVEIFRRGKSYSLETIRQIKAHRQEEDFFFIMGLDAFREIETWFKYEELLAECDFIITSRPGCRRKSLSREIPASLRPVFKRSRGRGEFIHRSGRRLIFCDVTDLNISSTAIRAMLREGLSVRYLLPRRVMDYIHEHQLYH